jgi:hypothetical protein
MELARIVEDILRGKKRLEDERPNLFRLQRLINEKREKGILPQNNHGLPTLQETERHSHDMIFGR